MIINEDEILDAAIDLQQAYRWRLGQSVFNLLDTAQYGHLGRVIQEKYEVDCFYDDSKIGAFLKCAKRLCDEQGKY